MVWDVQSELVSLQAITFLILARPGADLSMALLTFFQAKTKYTALTMWAVWAREFGFWISSLKFMHFRHLYFFFAFFASLRWYVSLGILGTAYYLLTT